MEGEIGKPCHYFTGGRAARFYDAATEAGPKPPCPSCGSGDAVKHGFRKRLAGRVQTWGCRACGRTFPGTVSQADPDAVEAARLHREIHGWVERRWPFHSTRRMSELILRRWGIRISHTSLARWVRGLNGGSTIPCGIERTSHEELVRRVIHAYKWGTPRSLGTACVLAGLRRQANTPYMVLKTILELSFEVPENRRLHGRITDKVKERVGEIYRTEGVPESAIMLATKIGWKPYAYNGILASITANMLGFPAPSYGSRQWMPDFQIRGAVREAYERCDGSLPSWKVLCKMVGARCVSPRLRRIINELGIEPPRYKYGRSVGDIERQISEYYSVHGVPRSANALRIALNLTGRTVDVAKLAEHAGLEPPKRQLRAPWRSPQEIETQIFQYYLIHGTPRSPTALKRAVGLSGKVAKIRRKVAELRLEQPSLWASRRQERIRKFLRLNTFGLPRYPLTEEEYLLIDFCEKGGAYEGYIGKEVRDVLTGLRLKGWVTLYPHGIWAPTPLGEAIYRRALAKGNPAIKGSILVLEGTPDNVRMEGDRLYIE